MMKTFKKVAAQGDCLLIRIDSLPEGLEEIKPEGNQNVVAHSETGHNHVMTAERTKLYKQPDVKDRDLYELFLTVDEDTPLKHMRSFDTHETLLVPKGVYSIRRQREHSPEGFRRAAD